MEKKIIKIHQVDLQKLNPRVNIRIRFNCAGHIKLFIKRKQFLSSFKTRHACYNNGTKIFTSIKKEIFINE